MAAFAAFYECYRAHCIRMGVDPYSPEETLACLVDLNLAQFCACGAEDATDTGPTIGAERPFH